MALSCWSGDSSSLRPDFAPPEAEPLARPEQTDSQTEIPAEAPPSAQLKELLEEAAPEVAPILQVLAERGLPLPVVGEDAQDPVTGECLAPVELAWQRRHLAVLLEEDEKYRRDLEDAGWICLAEMDLRNDLTPLLDQLLSSREEASP
jgi:hypothetical protein